MFPKIINKEEITPLKIYVFSLQTTRHARFSLLEYIYGILALHCGVRTTFIQSDFFSSVFEI